MPGCLGMTIDNLPRLLTKWLRRNSFALKNNNVAFIFLNQVRASIGSYVKGYTSPGGHALKHFEAIKIKFTKGGKLEVGKEVKAKIKSLADKVSKDSLIYKLNGRVWSDVLKGIEALADGKIVNINVKNPNTGAVQKMPFATIVDGKIVPETQIGRWTEDEPYCLCNMETCPECGDERATSGGLDDNPEEGLRE